MRLDKCAAMGDNCLVKRKVLVVCWELGKTSETFISQIVERLPHSVVVFEWCAVDTGTRLGQKSFFRRIAQRFLDSPMPRANSLCLSALEQCIRSQEVDLVLAETGPLAALVAPVCKSVSVPMVAHFHGVDAYAPELTGDDGANYAFIRDHAAGIICVSRHMSDHFDRLGWNSSKIHYATSFVDPTVFSGARPEAAGPVFLSVGRLIEKKGLLLTLMAMQQVVKAVPDSRLIVVGEGCLDEPCRQFIKGAGIDGNVEFLGAQSHAVVSRLMKEVRCYVQHSVVAANNDHEGTPVAILEAQISGLPVVSTRHAGIPEVVEENVTGFLVDEFDVDTMAHHMIRVATDPVLAKELGRSARQIVSQKFSFDETLGRLGTIINDVYMSSENLRR